jgi:manganese transport protein
MQLPFAVVPLVHFVANARIMGKFAIPRWLSAVSWLVAGIIIALNVLLLYQMW